LTDVTVNGFAAMVKAVEATQLPAAMSYGPLAAGAWAVIQVIKAIRRRLPSAPAARSDHE
jgi:hypothetical protein